MKKIKLILSDLDGTLFNHESIVTKETIEVIKKIKEKGILFGIATGRTPFDIEQRLQGELLSLVDVIIGSNGYEVKDYRDCEIIYSELLPQNATKEILDMFKEMHYNAFFGDEEGLHCACFCDMMKNILGIDQKFLHHSDEEFCQLSIAKLCLMFDEDQTEYVKDKIKHMNQNDYYGSQTAPMIFEFQHKTTSKYQGIKRFIEKYHINNSEVMAFGDAGNDFDMIAHVGVGVAMKNASEDIKIIANEITEYNNDDHGVAHYLLKNIIKEDIM